MDFLEILKKLLGEDTYKKLEADIEEHNKKPENKDNQVKLGNLGSGEYVSTSKYMALEAERDGLKEKLKGAEDTITTLKKAGADNEELQKTIKTHEENAKQMQQQYEAKIRSLSIDMAIREKLTDTKYADLLASKFDRDKLKVNDDGTVSGIDDQLKGIRETYKELFNPAASGKKPERKPQGLGAGSAQRAELEKIVNDLTKPLAVRVSAQTQLSTMKED